MRKLILMFTITLVTTIVLPCMEAVSGDLFVNVEALTDGGESSSNRYQTMGYCRPWTMDYMCTSTYTAESCRRPC